jgi:hypothetical protein
MEIQPRVARWHIFIPKIPIWVNLGVALRTMDDFMAIWSTYFMAIWSILWPFCIFCGHLVYFMAIWSILWTFGLFYGHFVYCMVIYNIFPVLVCCDKINLATLIPATFLF